MATVSNTVTVNDSCGPLTPGSFSVVAHYVTTTGDPGSKFGPFASREAAEKCLTAVAERTDVKAAELVINP